MYVAAVETAISEGEKEMLPQALNDRMILFIKIVDSAIVSLPYSLFTIA